MRVALEGSVSGGTWSIDANVKSDSKSKTALFELRVTEFGGPQNGFSKLVTATGIEKVLEVMNSYLQQPAPLSTMVPISYTANTVRDDQLAAMSVTTKYTVTKYIPDPIGERYRIKMWFEVTGSDDGVSDNTIECYGTLRVNGDVWWTIDREQTIKREAGQTIDISEDAARRKKEFLFDFYYDGTTPFQLDLRMRDADDRSGDDDVGIYNQTLDLRSLAGKKADFDWDGRDGTSGWLHIQVERVDYF